MASEHAHKAGRRSVHRVKGGKLTRTFCRPWWDRGRLACLPPLCCPPETLIPPIQSSGTDMLRSAFGRWENTQLSLRASPACES